MIGRTNAGGGGGDLNFRVFGQMDAPSAPKENDIWAKTTTDWTKYAIADSAGLSGADDGKTLVINIAAANWWNTENRTDLLKKNDLWVSPNGAKRYVNGVWTNLDAYIRHGSNWVQFSRNRLVLFDGANGGDNTSATGGWGASSYVKEDGGSQFISDASCTVTNNVITAQGAASTYYTLAGTKKKVNLSGLSKLHVTVTEQANPVYCYIKSNNVIEHAEPSNYVAYVLLTGPGSYEITIPANIGECYITFCRTNVVAKVVISEVYAE